MRTTLASLLLLFCVQQAPAQGCYGSFAGPQSYDFAPQYAPQGFPAVGEYAAPASYGYAPQQFSGGFRQVCGPNGCYMVPSGYSFGGPQFAPQSYGYAPQYPALEIIIDNRGRRWHVPRRGGFQANFSVGRGY